METISNIVGHDGTPLLWWQMVCRGVLVFFYLMLLVRFGGMRALGNNTTLDIVLGVLLGSTLSRCLTGNSPFFPTLAASAALVVLHKALAYAAFYSKGVGALVKGTRIELVQNGRILHENLRKSTVTEHDLNEALRLRGRTTDLAKVKSAYLERSGEISFVTD